MKLIDVDSGRVTLLKNVPEVLVQGQGGMLDVALSPNYEKEGWIYFTYVKDVDIDTEGVTVLARAKLVSDTFEDCRSYWLQSRTLRKRIILAVVLLLTHRVMYFLV